MRRFLLIALVVSVLHCGGETTVQRAPDGGATDGEAEGMTSDGEGGADATRLPKDGATPTSDGGLPTCESQIDCYNGGDCQDGICCNGFYQDAQCTCGYGPPCGSTEQCCYRGGPPDADPCIPAGEQCIP
jgi:hypothetical protein